MSIEDERLCKDLLEGLSTIEHKQWCNWSQNIWNKLESIKRAIDCNDLNTALFLINEIRSRWDKYWIPYEQLEEKVKDMDRFWAKKVIKLLEDKRLCRDDCKYSDSDVCQLCCRNYSDLYEKQ